MFQSSASDAAPAQDEPTITDLDVLANSLAASNQNGQFLHDLDQEVSGATVRNNRILQELSAFLDSLSPRAAASEAATTPLGGNGFQWQSSMPLAFNASSTTAPFTYGLTQTRTGGLNCAPPPSIAAVSSSVNVVSSTKPTSTSDMKGMTQCVCDQCGKVFNSVWYLKQHAVKHSNDRPFRCKYCGKVGASRLCADYFADVQVSLESLPAQMSRPCTTTGAQVSVPCL